MRSYLFPVLDKSLIIWHLWIRWQLIEHLDNSSKGSKNFRLKSGKLLEIFSYICKILTYRIFLNNLLWKAEGINWLRDLYAANSILLFKQLQLGLLQKSLKGRNQSGAWLQRWWLPGKCCSLQYISAQLLLIGCSQENQTLLQPSVQNFEGKYFQTG